MSSLADRIRRHVADVYVVPARGSAQTTVRVRAGDVHRALHLNNQVPAVCGAIDARKCLEFIGARSVHRTGPPQSTTAEWEFELDTKTKDPKDFSQSVVHAVWEGGRFRPLQAPDLVEGQHVALILAGLEAPPSKGGRFAAFAGTLSRQEAEAMRHNIDTEFGRIEGDW
jgi:hypothetical protein